MIEQTSSVREKWDRRALNGTRGEIPYYVVRPDAARPLSGVLEPANYSDNRRWPVG